MAGMEADMPNSKRDTFRPMPSTIYIWRWKKGRGGGVAIWNFDNSTGGTWG